MTSSSRILITGVSGFTGQYLAERCVARYARAQVYGMARAHSCQPCSIKGLELMLADVQDAQSVRHVVAQTRPNLVFHLAAQSSVAASWADPIGTLRVNVEGLLHLLEALRIEQLMPRMLVIGSSEEYGTVGENLVNEEHPFHPLNPYAVSKVAQDLFAYQYAVAYGLPLIRVRAFNHFGPRQAPQFVVASIARQVALIEAKKAEPLLLVGNTEAKRDFLPVTDVVEAYLALGERGRPGEAYNVGSGQAHSIAEVVQFLVRQVAPRIEVRVDPARYRPLDKGLLLADTAKVREHTSWQPQMNFQQALLHTLDYWREQVRSPDFVA